MAEHEVPDLHDIEEKIHAAHDAEDRLMHTMPNAIHPDYNAFPGMMPPSASPAAVEKNAAKQPEPDPESSVERRDDRGEVVPCCQSSWELGAIAHARSSIPGLSGSVYLPRWCRRSCSDCAGTQDGHAPPSAGTDAGDRQTELMS